MAAAALREQLNALLASMFASVSPLRAPVLFDRIGRSGAEGFSEFFFKEVLLSVAVAVQGLVDEQFQQLQMLQDDGSTPGFVAEVVTLFCDDADRIISELAALLYALFAPDCY
jgi:hypothetical protein